MPDSQPSCDSTPLYTYLRQSHGVSCIEASPPVWPDLVGGLQGGVRHTHPVKGRGRREEEDEGEEEGAGGGGGGRGEGGGGGGRGRRRRRREREEEEEEEEGEGGGGGGGGGGRGGRSIIPRLHDKTTVHVGIHVVVTLPTNACTYTCMYTNILGLNKCKFCMKTYSDADNLPVGAQSRQGPVFTRLYV